MTWPNSCQTLSISISLLVNRKGEHREMIEDAKVRGFVRLRINGEIVRTDEIEAWTKEKNTRWKLSSIGLLSRKMQKKRR